MPTGWRTVSDVPSDDYSWPPGTSFYHFDKLYNRLNVGYHGPTFSFASMPDQYTYAALQRREFTPGHKPLMAEIDTVSSHTHVNLSSDLLGSLYNPFAAVPSMHFGYSLIVGVAVFSYARRPLVRALGALYPPVMLFDIVATGNHFLFDAAMGGLVVAAAFVVARELDRRAAPVALPQPA